MLKVGSDDRCSLRGAHKNPSQVRIVDHVFKLIVESRFLRVEAEFINLKLRVAVILEIIAEAPFLIQQVDIQDMRRGPGYFQICI